MGHDSQYDSGGTTQPAQAMIYLDHNATTPPTPSAAAAVQEALSLESGLWANPSSVHRAGQAVRHRLELARESLARLLRVDPKHLVFTSGGTESINLAIRGTLDALATPPSSTPPIIVTSRVEHAAIRDLVEDRAKLGKAAVRWAPIDSDGLIQSAALDELLPGATIAAFQWANNETGIIQPIDAIGQACRRHRVRFLCDGTQWIGKLPVPYDASSRFAPLPPSRLGEEGRGEGFASTSPSPPYDLLACSAHKFYGPKGVGLLWSNPATRWRPQSPGSQELGRRAGTENVPGILGAGAAAEDSIRWLEDPGSREHQRTLRDRFERGVLEACPGSRINAPGAGPHARLWNTTNIAFPRLEAEALLLLLSERGVAASAGAACSSGSLDPSPVLLAMGIPEELAHGSLRFSLGRDTTQAEIDDAIIILRDSVSRLSASSSQAIRR